MNLHEMKYNEVPARSANGLAVAKVPVTVKRPERAKRVKNPVAAAV